MPLLVAVLALVSLQDDAAESFLSFKPGTRWVYRSQTPDNRELRSETTVLDSKPGTMSVESVHTEGAKPVGKMAQTWKDRDGFVWLDVVAVYRPGSKKGDQWRYKVVQDEITAEHRG